MARRPRRNRFFAGAAASLILRVSLAVTLAILSMTWDTISPPLSVTSAVLGCLIASGFLARGAAFATIALLAAFRHEDLAFLLPIAAEASSILLVGAGAFSIDELVLHRRLTGWRDRP